MKNITKTFCDSSSTITIELNDFGVLSFEYISPGHAGTKIEMTTSKDFTVLNLCDFFREAKHSENGLKKYFHIDNGGFTFEVKNIQGSNAKMIIIRSSFFGYTTTELAMKTAYSFNVENIILALEEMHFELMKNEEYKNWHEAWFAK